MADKIPFLLQEGPAPMDLPFGEPAVPKAPTIKLDEASLQERAVKNDIALGDNSPGAYELKRMEELGTLQGLVDNIALQRDLAKTQERQELVQTMARDAAAQGRQLSGVEQDVLYGLTSPEIQRFQTDPDTFLQKEFAKKVVDLSLARGEDNPLDDPAVLGAADAAVEHIARKEGLTRIAQDMRAVVAKQGWVPYALDVAKEFFPFYTWAKTRSAVEDEAGINVASIGAFLPGTNLEEQISYIYSLPVEEGLRVARRTVEGLAQDNPQLAERFANALISYDSAFIDNLLIAGTDALTFGLVAPLRGAVRAGATAGTVGAEVLARGVAKAATSTQGLKAGASAAKALEKLKPVIQAATRREATVEGVQDAAGDLTGSAITHTLKTVQDALSNAPARDVRSWRDMQNTIPSIFDAGRILDGPTVTLATESTNRLIAHIQSFNDDFLKKMFVDPLQTSYRLSPRVLKTASDYAEQLFRDQYRRLNDAVIDSDVKVGENAGLVFRLGDNGANLFKTEAQAIVWADEVYALPEGAYSVRPHGTSGYYLEMFQPFDLTRQAIKDARKIDTKASTPVANAVGNYLLKYRTGDDVLPQEVVQAFKRAVYGGSSLLRAIEQSAKAIGKLKNNEDFLDFLSYQQTKINPNDPNKLGTFSRTLGAFEIEWASRFNRLPTEAEATAYFTYTQLNDAHYMYLNYSYFLDKTSRGLTDNIIPGVSNSIEGKFVQELPDRSHEPARVLILENGAAPRVFNTHFTTHTKTSKAQGINARQEVEALMKKGYQLMQVSPHGARQLADSDELSEFLRKKGQMHFILSKKIDSRPLPFKQIPYSPGGHHMYPEGFFIRQPRLYESLDKDTGNIRRVEYYGDVNLFHAANKEIAAKMAAKFELARNILRDTFDSTGKVKGNLDPELVLAAQKNIERVLPISYKEFRKMFFGKNAQLDLDTPITFSSSNVSLGDAGTMKTIGRGKAAFSRASDSEWNLYKGMDNMQFAMERGDPLSAVVNMGSKDRPIWGITPAQKLDPMAALDRSLNGLRNGRYMEELKKGTAERFVAEFEDLLDLSNPAHRVDPFLAATEAPLKTPSRTSAQDLTRLNQAEVYRARFRQFLGYRTPTEQRVAASVEKLLGGVSPDLATGWRKSWHEVLSNPNPLDKLKEVAFFYKMGFWNPKHLILQSQTAAHVVALAGPKIGMQSIGTSMIQNFVMHSPGDLTDVGAKMLRKLGWGNEAWFKEATEALQRTGYDNVGREVATREQHLRSRILQTKMGAVLDHGLLFFKKGEEFIRRASFNAAYLEWRTANPTAKMTDDTVGRILNRADQMNVNMSQASNAEWQQGALSLGGQFLSYQIRLTEQLVGKRLTGAEKRRLMYTYSAAYGVPVGVPLATFGFLPVHDAAKQYLLGKGVDIEDTTVFNAMNEGIVGLFSDVLFNEDVNAQTVYGPYGNNLLTDMFSGDKTFMEIALGASGGVVGEQIAATAPFFKWLWSALDATSPETPPLTFNDFAKVVAPISTANSAYKSFVAMNTGNYYTKRGDLVASGNEGFGAFVQAWLGLQPQAIDDLWSSFNQVRRRGTIIRDQQKLAIRDFQEMYKTDSREEAAEYHRRAMARMVANGFTPREMQDTIQDSLRNKSLIEKHFMRPPTSPENQQFNQRLMERWAPYMPDSPYRNNN